MSRLGVFLLTTLLAGRVGAADTPPPAETPAEAWREDAAALVEALTELHPRVDWVTPRDELDHRAERTLRAVAEATSDEARVVALMELIAAVRDGHTVLASSSRYDVFGWLPFSATWLADGVFFHRLPEERAEALGARILAVDGLPIELVLERLRRVVPHSTESRLRRWAPSYLHLPGLLHALGVTGSPARARFDVELRSGGRATIELERVPPEAEDEVSFVDLADELAGRLIRYRRPDRLYWFEPLAQGRAVYASYRRVGVDDAQSPWEFAAELASYVESHQEVERLIVDLRDNGGGGYQWAAHIGPTLARTRVNRPGALYILVGQRTFSAAIDWANWMRANTMAIFVGEPPGAPPVSPGDDDPVTLPNSGLVVNVSRLLSRTTFAGDRRREWLPDLAIAETRADLLAGRDAALEAVLAHRAAPGPEPSIEPEWLGRYRFDEDADLVISRQEAGLFATVTPRLRLLLRPIGRHRFATPIPGLTIAFAPGGAAVTLGLPGGEARVLERLEPERRSGWELFLAGDYEAAEAAFRRVLDAHPDHPFLADGALTSEAIHLVFTMRPRVGVEASRALGAELLRMCVRLHRGDAPSCEYSLRFYE